MLLQKQYWRPLAANSTQMGPPLQLSATIVPIPFHFPTDNAGAPALQQVTMSADAQHRIRTALARSASEALLEEAAARGAGGPSARPGARPAGAFGAGGSGSQQGYPGGAHPRAGATHASVAVEARAPESRWRPWTQRRRRQAVSLPEPNRFAMLTPPPPPPPPPQGPGRSRATRSTAGAGAPAAGDSTQTLRSFTPAACSRPRRQLRRRPTPRKCTLRLGCTRPGPPATQGAQWRRTRPPPPSPRPSAACPCAASPPTTAPATARFLSQRSNPPRLRRASSVLILPLGPACPMQMQRDAAVGGGGGIMAQGAPLMTVDPSSGLMVFANPAQGPQARARLASSRPPAARTHPTPFPCAPAPPHRRCRS